MLLMRPSTMVTTIGGAAYTYDPDGNVLSGGGNTYSYDVEGRLTGVTGADGVEHIRGTSRRGFGASCLEQVRQVDGSLLHETAVDRIGVPEPRLGVATRWAAKLMPSRFSRNPKQSSQRIPRDLGENV